jgi:hypothetical protein
VLEVSDIMVLEVESFIMLEFEEPQSPDLQSPLFLLELPQSPLSQPPLLLECEEDDEEEEDLPVYWE